MKLLLIILLICCLLNCSTEKNKINREISSKLDPINYKYNCVYEANELDEISDCISSLLNIPKILKDNEYRLTISPESPLAIRHDYTVIFYNKYAWIEHKQMNSFDVSPSNFPAFKNITYQTQIFEIDSMRAVVIKLKFDNIFKDSTYHFKREDIVDKPELISGRRIFTVRNSVSNIYLTETMLKNTKLEKELIQKIDTLVAYLQ